MLEQRDENRAWHPRPPASVGGSLQRVEGGEVDSSLPPSMLRGRQRQQRSVYSVEQRDELERFFQNNHYPSYEERETLAARLNLQENQVQVWFKNRRAKFRKMEEQTPHHGQADGGGIHGHGVRARGRPRALAPAPAPATAPASAPPPAAVGHGFLDDLVLDSGPGFSGGATAPGGAVFQGDPGFYGPPPPNPFGGVAAAGTSASSDTQAWSGLTQDTQNPVPAAAAAASAASAPAADPVWPEDPNASSFCPDLFETPTFADLLSAESLEGPSSLLSGFPEGEESGGEDDSGPKVLQDL
ncbi:cone-rod homeobox protein-like [Desmodus rotundus]|uniref:cone-rod homeobox protein-like n=1 Tax=Desmodus rotundus TaxID=9430 RepID=UPI00238151A9|nr:cone-rod homeobox protein-like [Desmodus rotundus]